MESHSEPEISIEGHMAEERQPLINDTNEPETQRNRGESGADDFFEKNADNLPIVSIYSLVSSEKIESTADRGFMTFMKNLIGTGILALPYVIQDVGLIPAWILLASIGLLNFYTMELLNEVANTLRIVKVDLGRLCESVVGRKWIRYLAELNIYALQLGGCLPSLIFILQYLDNITCLYGWSVFCGKKYMQVLLIFAFVLPLGAITDLHYLSIPSGIAMFIQFTFYITFIVICGEKIYTNGIAAGSFTDYDLSYLPIAFASVLFAYEGIGLVLEIRASVADNKEFDRVLKYSFLSSTLAYTLFGTLGKLAFGDTVLSVIFLNLNQDNHFIVFLEFAYLFALMIAIPAAIFPPSRIIENWHVFRDWVVDPTTGTKSRWKRQLIRQPLIVIIVLVAAIAPSFNVVISLLGGFNFTILSFVIPVILYNTLFRNDQKKQKNRIFNAFILLIGIILGSIATVESIQEIFASTA